MLKSKLIDTKYVDPKGVARTPNVITSITEDEIKEGKFSLEDILPATAVQVALNSIKPETFPIPYTEDNRTLTFQLGQSGYDNVNVQLAGKIFRIGTGDQAGNLKCLFSDDDVQIHNARSKDGYTEYMVVDYEQLQFNRTASGNLQKYTSVGIGNIHVHDITVSGYCEIGADYIQIRRNAMKYTIGWNHLQILMNIATNASKRISDVATSATLSDLISSYNSLLAHLRTSGILKS